MCKYVPSVPFGPAIFWNVAATSPWADVPDPVADDRRDWSVTADSRRPSTRSKSGKSVNDSAKRQGERIGSAASDWWEDDESANRSKGKTRDGVAENFA